MANYITMLRIILILPILYYLTPEASLSNWFALLLFITAGLTDHFDGYVARKTETQSSFGAVLDLVADKLLIIMTISYLISYSSNVFLLLPSLIIIFREVVISSIRQFITESIGSNPIEVSLLAKSKTTLQIFAISFLIISPNFGQYFLLFTIFLFWLAAYVSIHSLYGYLKTYGNLLK